MLERERLRLCDRSFDRPSSLVSVERARTRLEGRWKEEGSEGRHECEICLGRRDTIAAAIFPTTS